MKKGYYKELTEIKKMVEAMSKSPLRMINENINFEDEYGDMDMNMEDDEMENEMPEEPQRTENDEEMPVDNNSKSEKEDLGMKELDKAGTIDDIREITLRGMIRLNKEPENPEYQALLKIFQICNKAVEPKEDENNKKRI